MTAVLTLRETAVKSTTVVTEVKVTVTSGGGGSSSLQDIAIDRTRAIEAER
jgi:hypothetical protein